MKLRTKLVMAVLSVSIVTVVSSVSKAEDDNVYDGKSYPGSFCDSVTSTVSSYRAGPFYVNISGGVTSVNCPMVQDSWVSTGGLTFGAMYLYNPGGTFTCTQTAYESNGTSIMGAKSFTTTAVGVQQQLFYQGGYVPTTGNFGSLSIVCSVPNGGQIRSYQGQERA